LTENLLVVLQICGQNSGIHINIPLVGEGLPGRTVDSRWEGRRFRNGLIVSAAQSWLLSVCHETHNDGTLWEQSVHGHLEINLELTFETAFFLLSLFLRAFATNTEVHCWDDGGRTHLRQLPFNAAADGFLLINEICGAAERKQIMSTTCPRRTEVYNVPIDTLQHGYK
jgi:hypothetical protein